MTSGLKPASMKLRKTYENSSHWHSKQPFVMPLSVMDGHGNVLFHDLSCSLLQLETCKPLTMKYWESQFSQDFLYIFIILAILCGIYYHGLRVRCLVPDLVLLVPSSNGQGNHDWWDHPHPETRPCCALSKTKSMVFLGVSLTGMGPNLVL